jgi:hypothetical protein
MAVDERSRHPLYRRLQEILGEEEATTLMAHLPSGGADRVATKDDLRLEIQALEHRLTAEIHRTARNLTLSLTTIVAVLNGIIFTALRLGA